MLTISESHRSILAGHENRQHRSPLHVVLTIGIAMFLLVGAVGKAFEPDGVVTVILYVLQPIGLTSTVALLLTSGLVLFEGLLAWALLCGVRLRLTLLATFITLVLFTLVLAYLAVRPTAPPCNCGGAVSIAHGGDSPIVGMFRNLGLIWLLCGLWMTAPSRDIAQPPEPCSSEPRPPEPRASEPRP